MSLLEDLKNQQDQLISKVNYLLSKCDFTEQVDLLPNTIQFPLDSMEEVDDFENWLQDPANSQQRHSMVCIITHLKRPSKPSYFHTGYFYDSRS